jgi:hypothetical protein
MEKVTGRFKVVEYLPTRGGSRAIIEDEKGNRYSMFASEFFKILNGFDLGNMTIVKTRKGEAVGWRRANAKEAAE